MEKQEMLEQNAVCREIGARTGGDILIGLSLIHISFCDNANAAAAAEA